MGKEEDLPGAEKRSMDTYGASIREQPRRKKKAPDGRSEEGDTTGKGGVEAGGDVPLKATPTMYVFNLIFAWVSLCCGCVFLALPAIYFSRKAVREYPYRPDRASRHCYTGALLWVLASVGAAITAAIVLTIYVRKYDLLREIPEHERLGGWDS